MKTKIAKKIQNKQATIGVMGLGYVGLPLAVEAAKNGYKTIGFDPNQDKVQKLLNSESYVDDISNEAVSRMIAKGSFLPSTDFSQIGEVDIIFICVPTPLDNHSQPDTNYIVEAAEIIVSYFTRETVVVLESTTYPGTTRDLVKPILESKGLSAEGDFYLGFSPERIDPGNEIYTPANTPKVVSGLGQEATELITTVYEAILKNEVHQVSSPEVAEMEKILENTYRNINIGMINELAIFCEKMKINIWEVIEAAKTKPYGFQAFYPGPGLGGHCIPLDPYYLSWKAKEFNFHTSMIENSTRINDSMPDYTVQRIAKILNHFNQSVSGAKILLLGIAYKPDISDSRESPAIQVAERLKAEGARINYYDPFVPAYQNGKDTFQGLSELTSDAIASYDLLVITTAHTKIDYQFVQQNARFIFDTRNATAAVANKENIELL